MRKQALPYMIRLIRNADGERLPALIDRTTGLPEFDASLWVVSSLRTRNLASESIAQALRSLVVLYIALRTCKVNLTERLGTGHFLSPGDIAEILKQCGQTVERSVEACEGGLDTADRITKKITSLEKLRMVQAMHPKGGVVGSGTASIRLGYIREFLRWRANKAIARTRGDAKQSLMTLRNLVDDELRLNTPAGTGRATVQQRKGIDRESQERLLGILSPTSQKNPWTGNRMRVRNQFIVNAFLALGIRRGEFLGLRVGDFNQLSQEVLILRRPDDANDPRLDEPNAKTRDRVLPVSYGLHALMKEYLMLRHELVRGRHDFLIVANSGEPMCKSEINRIFNVLSKGLTENVTPHTLRHTFFENLADDLHRAGKGDVEIANILTVLGGWSPASNSPTRYTTRFAQERANIAALALQQKLYIHDRPGRPS